MTGQPNTSRQMAPALRVAWGIGLRGTKAWLLSPPFFVITMLFPLVFLAAFSGALSSLFYVEGFKYSEGYTAFVYGFVILQAAAFGGIFTGYSTARDFELGFAPRLFLASPRRTPIIAGYAIVAVIRSLIAAMALTVAALLSGMRSHVGLVQVAQLAAMIVVVAVIASLWACGVAMRVRATRGGPFMYSPILVILFLTPVYVPASLLHGWLIRVVHLNPMTYMVEGARSLLAGNEHSVGQGFGLCLALVVLAAAWAIRGVRRAERSTW